MRADPHGHAGPDTSASAESATVSFTDSTGREVELPREITRIASAGPLANIMLYAMAPDELVGWSNKPDDDAAKYLDQKYLDLPEYGKFYGDSGDFNREAAMVMTSAPEKPSWAVSTPTLGMPYSFSTHSANAFALSRKISKHTIFLTDGNCVMIATKHALLIGPHPTTDTTSASLRARYFAPTPGTPPVLAALKRFADISTKGDPVSLSFSITVRIDRGRPLGALA